MRQAESRISNLAGGEAGVVTTAVGGIPVVGKFAQPFVQSDKQQQYHQAQRDWVRAKLRKESGATIRDEEEAEEIRTYFPQPGDTPEVIMQKAESRKAAQRQMEIGAGAALDQVDGSSTGQGPASSRRKKWNQSTGKLE
jgi:hypothetical protein